MHAQIRGTSRRAQALVRRHTVNHGLVSGRQVKRLSKVYASKDNLKVVECIEEMNAEKS